MEMYFSLLYRPAESGEYVYSFASGEIYKVDGTMEDGRVVHSQYYEDSTGFYNFEIIEAREYLVLKLVDPNGHLDTDIIEG